MKTKKIKLNKLNCSPYSKNKNKNNFTCYTSDFLLKLKKRWNQRHPDVNIQTNDPKKIHEQLSVLLNSICDNELCWMKQISNEEKNEKWDEFFSPKMPIKWKKNPNEWLSSVDITNVMQQYEKAYPCFSFIGPSPIDFDEMENAKQCVWDELCHFQISNFIKDKKKKIGIIFNTDKHDKSGEHWISLFIHIPKKYITFFDSVGNTSPAEIKHFVKRIQKQGLELNPPIHFTYDENHPVEHQYGNTECGMYSLFFIIHLLEDKLSKEYFKTHILKDKYIERYRTIFFNQIE
jgi:hypothetical protein